MENSYKITNTSIKKISKEDLIVDGVDGTATFSKYSHLFVHAYSEPFDLPKLSTPDNPTSMTHVNVYAVVEENTICNIYKNFSIDLTKVALTQHQILNLLYKYPDYFKEANTFLLIKRCNEVARTICLWSYLDGSLHLQSVDMHYPDIGDRFSYSTRIIVPDFKA